MLTATGRDALGQCLQHRVDGHRSAMDDACGVADANYIPKCKRPTKPSQFRPIVVANQPHQEGLGGLGDDDSCSDGRRIGEQTIPQYDGLMARTTAERPLLLPPPHREQSALGETLLIAKMDVTKAFDATDLRTAYQGARHDIDEKAAYLLIKELWAGNLRLKRSGDYPCRPAVKKHKGLRIPRRKQLAGHLFVYTAEAYVWKRWKEMADAQLRYSYTMWASGTPYVGGRQHSEGGHVELREATSGESAFQDRGRRGG